MFLDFYKMKAQPFGVTPDPRFLYLGKSHREALASLYYGIESERGFVALIAPPGLGKTTLAFQLLEKLQQASRTVFLFQTQCNAKEFFHYLLSGLGVDAQGLELVSMHNKLNEILCREMLAGRRFVLAIDEAQNLDPEVLESIRLLSNFETSRDKMLQILLIGQPQLAKKLASPELEQLQQRISMFARLEPFGYEDTARYIAHRLQVAGYEGGPLFSPGALRLIAEHSQGIPRKINSLCFSALSLGCAMDRKQVDVGMMEEVIADRDVESLQRPSVARRVEPSPVAPHPVLSSPVASRPALSSPMAHRPTLSSYPENPKRSFGRWAMGAAGVAACVAIGIGILSFSPSRIDRSIQASSEAWAAIRKAAGSIRGFMTVKSDSAPLSPNLNVQAAGLPNSEAKQSSLLSDEAGTKTVIVQPGDTLRQIILRTIGEYNGDTIDQVRKLNLDIADVDHLEVGQAIRLPRVSVVVDSAGAREAASIAGKD
jgi:type II secretory pathway predicted ATPase ExeA